MKNFLEEDDARTEKRASAWTDKLVRSPEVMSLFEAEVKEQENFVISEAPVDSAGENARRSGLAFSAGVAFFGSVVFMMLLGWFADLLFGSSPWGMVGGIVLGSLIGFVQLFRLSSQIFRK